ncbi:MAG: N-acetylneuraminate synthase [Candidatus Binatia bacterium]
MLETISIGGRKIGKAHPVFIVAEAGVNHNGDVKLALELIRKAKACGADCVKFQTFKAGSVVTRKAPKAAYQLEVTDRAESQLEMLKKIELPEGCYPELMGLCEDLGIRFLSTPYNFADVDLLNRHGVSAFKIASGQIVETPLLEYVAKIGKPVIVSTGMATLAEIQEGLGAIRQAGNDQAVLLQCTTNYPSRIEDSNIRAMVALGAALEVLVGYSDHTQSDIPALAAVALGAVVIEKHFTLDRTLPGPDHSCSLEPQDLARFVRSIRSVEEALGSCDKAPTEAERRNMLGMRRSIVAVRDIPAGTSIALGDVEFKRPAVGLEPKRLRQVLGQKAKVDILADTPLTAEMIDW